jgi:hypothetical protein
LPFSAAMPYAMSNTAEGETHSNPPARVF